jgi:hypothetical protein
MMPYMVVKVDYQVASDTIIHKVCNGAWTHKNKEHTEVCSLFAELRFVELRNQQDANNRLASDLL